MASWDRQRNEPPVAFECFCAYRDLLEARSIAKAYEKRTGFVNRKTRPKCWAIWFDQFQWENRTVQYIDYLDKFKADSIADVEKNHAEQMARHRMKHKETEHALSKTMMKKVQDILEQPITKQKTLDKVVTSPDGKEIHKHYTQFFPVRHSMNSAALLLVAASKIGRMSLDIKDDETDIAPEDFSKLFFVNNLALVEATNKGAIVPVAPLNPSAPPAMQLPPNELEVDLGSNQRPPPVRPKENGGDDGT